SRVGIAGEHQLGDVADPADGRVHLFGMDGVAQSENVGVRRENGEARTLVAILDHRAVDKDPFARGELQDKAAHAPSPSPLSPRMTAVLMSIRTSTVASPAITRRLCSLVNCAR